MLVDRNGLFNAGLGGKKWRAIDLFDGDELDGAAFKELVREAVGHNAMQLSPKSSGSAISGRKPFRRRC